VSERLALLGGEKSFTMIEELHEANRWPVIGDEEVEAVRAAMLDPSIYAPIAAFEQDFAAYTGSKFVLATNNGSSAIHSAYFAAGVGPGDEVICPSYTWHMQISQIPALHAIPVFCDIDPKDATISVEDIKRRISPHTKAIAIVHPFGAVCPMDEIMAVAREHNLPVIEDCSHAHGALYKGRKVGTIGDIGCFSLQASKLLCAVEGGVMVTDNEEYYERAVVLGHYERIPKLTMEKHRRFYTEKVGAPACFGFKYRIHPWAAAFARVELAKLDKMNASRRANLEYLTEGLRALGDGFEPPYEAPGTKRTWLNYVCQYYEGRMGGVARERFIEALNAEGLPVSGGRTGYLPVYYNPLFEERVGMWGEDCPFDCCHTHRRVEYNRGDCPEAEVFWTRTVGLPVFPHPCDRSLLDQVIGTVGKVIRGIGELQ